VRRPPDRGGLGPAVSARCLNVAHLRSDEVGISGHEQRLEGRRPVPHLRLDLFDREQAARVFGLRDGSLQGGPRGGRVAGLGLRPGHRQRLVLPGLKLTEDSRDGRIGRLLAGRGEGQHADRRDRPDHLLRRESLSDAPCLPRQIVPPRHDPPPFVLARTMRIHCMIFMRAAWLSIVNGSAAVPSRQDRRRWP
jgi:hypothetical protein